MDSGKHKAMNTPLSFTVTVTGCKNCPSHEWRTYNDIVCDEWCGEAGNDSWQLIHENKDQLTPICPMWDKTKESETK